MRTIPITVLAVFAAIGLSAPANADQTVTYRGDDGRNLVLEIDDGGSVRVAGPGAEAAIIIGGELFLVGDEGGKPRVVRMTDIAAVFAEAIGPIFKTLFDKAAEAAPTASLTITPLGGRTFAGFKGDAYKVQGLDTTKPDVAVEWIASNEPALAPAGAALRQFIDLTLVMATPFLGKQVESMLAENRRLFALGTPLDAGGKFRLESVKEGDIDDARFKLPAEPLTREALRAEVQAKAAPADE